MRPGLSWMKCIIHWISRKPAQSFGRPMGESLWLICGQLLWKWSQLVNVCDPMAICYWLLKGSSFCWGNNHLSQEFDAEFGRHWMVQVCQERLSQRFMVISNGPMHVNSSVFCFSNGLKPPSKFFVWQCGSIKQFKYFTLTLRTRAVKWFNEHSPKKDNLGSANCDDQMSSLDDQNSLQKRA